MKRDLLVSPDLRPPSPNNHLKYPLVLWNIWTILFEEVIHSFIHSFNNCYCRLTGYS